MVMFVDYRSIDVYDTEPRTQRLRGRGLPSVAGVDNSSGKGIARSAGSRGKQYAAPCPVPKRIQP